MQQLPLTAGAISCWLGRNSGWSVQVPFACFLLASWIPSCRDSHCGFEGRTVAKARAGSSDQYQDCAHGYLTHHHLGLVTAQPAQMSITTVTHPFLQLPSAMNGRASAVALNPVDVLLLPSGPTASWQMGLAAVRVCWDCQRFKHSLAMS